MMMKSQLIQSAFENASEIVVHLRENGDIFRGIVKDCSENEFTLFHHGSEFGMLWAFEHRDILACALVVPVPNEVRSDTCPAMNAEEGLTENTVPKQQEADYTEIDDTNI